MDELDETKAYPVIKARPPWLEWLIVVLGLILGFSIIVFGVLFA